MNLGRLPAVLVAYCLAGCHHEVGAVINAPILLYAGAGTSRNDVRAIADLLQQEHLAFATLSEEQLDAMSTAELGHHRLLIVPGGNFVDMGKKLAPATSAHVRDAVHEGVNYLGFCAGAFMAGNSPYNGFNLTGGRQFGFYSAEARGVRRAALAIRLNDGRTTENYWEDGPALTGWGTSIATYPDGSPAVAQGFYGKGLVLLSGTHPEAPESWRAGLAFTTPVQDSHDYARSLIRRAYASNPSAAR